VLKWADGIDSFLRLFPVVGRSLRNQLVRLRNGRVAQYVLVWWQHHLRSLPVAGRAVVRRVMAGQLPSLTQPATEHPTTSSR
jgi:hypothetical protein